MLLYIPLLLFYLVLLVLFTQLNITSAVTTYERKRRWKKGKILHQEMDDDIPDLKTLKRSKKQKRKPKYRHRRIDMDEHIRMCEYTHGFQSRYHMSRKAFDMLCEILDIQVNEKNSVNLQKVMIR